jgi:hypothetical protein
MDAALLSVCFLFRYPGCPILYSNFRASSGTALKSFAAIPKRSADQSCNGCRRQIAPAQKNARRFVLKHRAFYYLTLCETVTMK